MEHFSMFQNPFLLFPYIFTIVLYGCFSCGSLFPTFSISAVTTVTMGSKSYQHYVEKKNDLSNTRNEVGCITVHLMILGPSMSEFTTHKIKKNANSI